MSAVVRANLRLWLVENRADINAALHARARLAASIAGEPTPNPPPAPKQTASQDTLPPLPDEYVKIADDEPVSSDRFGPTVLEPMP